MCGAPIWSRFDSKRLKGTRGWLLVSNKRGTGNLCFKNWLSSEAVRSWPRDCPCRPRSTIKPIPIREMHTLSGYKGTNYVRVMWKPSRTVKGETMYRMYRVIALLVAAGFVIARAQSFEVASVKIPPPHVIGQPYDITVADIQNDTITFTNASLADCIRYAYGLSSNLQLSAPDWVRSTEARYDIVAKTAPGTQRDQFPKMMQALLADRFKLVFHRQQRALGYYALVVAKGGLRMHEPTAGPATLPAGVNGQLRILSNRMPMSDVVSLLSRYMHALVVDQTGLAGEFEVKLVWTPDDRPAPGDEQGASVFAAVEEQLGLKLEARKGPMEVIVVDHAEKIPTEN